MMRIINVLCSKIGLMMIGIVILLANLALANPCNAPNLVKQLKDARDLSDSGNKSAAIDALVELNNVCPNPRFLFYMCKVHQGWNGHCKEGLDVCNRFIKECRYCPDRERGEKLHLALDEECHAQVEFTSNPSNILISINGLPVGRTPVIRRLLEGEYTIKSVSLEFASYQSKIYVKRDHRSQKHHIAFNRMNTRSKPRQTTALAHKDSAADSSKDVYLGAGWAGVVLTVIGGITGGIYLNSYYEKKKLVDDIKKDCGPGEECTGPNIKGPQTDAESAAKLSAVGFSIAVAGGISAVLFFGLSLDEKETVTLRPVFGFNSAGIQLNF